MVFESERQRRAFFAQKARILSNISHHKGNLAQQRETFKKTSEIKTLNQELVKVKQAEKNVKKAQFQASPLGKRIARVKHVSKAAASKVVEYEKVHGEHQKKKLKSLGKDFLKLFK